MIASQEAPPSWGQSASPGTDLFNLKLSASGRHGYAQAPEPELNATILEIDKNSAYDSIGS